MNPLNKIQQRIIQMTDSDIVEAMKKIDGYIDITPSDFKEIYKLAYEHALTRLSLSLKAKDIMKSSVLKVLPDTALLNVAEIMAENNITGLPVVENHYNVAGVISEKDFLRDMGLSQNHSFMALVSQCLKRSGCMAVSLKNKKAIDIMSFPAITVHEDTSVQNIVQVIETNQINRVPVVDKNDRLCGIITRSDIMKAITR